MPAAPGLPVAGGAARPRRGLDSGCLLPCPSQAFLSFALVFCALVQAAFWRAHSPTQVSAAPPRRGGPAPSLLRPPGEAGGCGDHAGDTLCLRAGPLLG